MSTPRILRRSRRLGREVYRHLRRDLASTFATVLTSAVALSLLGVALIAAAQIATMKDYWYDKVEVSVFLCTDSSDSPTCAGAPGWDTKQKVLDTLNSLPQVHEVYYETSEEAWALFEERFANTDLVANLSADAMPESFRIKLVDPNQGSSIAAALEGTRGVEQVQDQRQMLERFFSILEKVQTASVSVAIAALIAAAALIAVGIRVAASHKQSELLVMRLVGATSGAIRRPFVAAAILQGLAGGLLAAGTVIALKYWFIDAQFPATGVVRVVTWTDVQAISLSLIAVGVAVALTVGFLSTMRYLRR